jgi:hypothetical protein
MINYIKATCVTTFAFCTFLLSIITCHLVSYSPEMSRVWGTMAFTTVIFALLTFWATCVFSDV